MKKSLLALAVLGAFAGAASAQSSVTIYGSLDLGITKSNGGTAGNNAGGAGNGAQAKAWTLQSANAPRLGFRGNEDLGGGLSAQFQIEHRFNVDTGTQANLATFWQGRSYLQLSSASAGRVYLGRDYAAAFWPAVKSDPFGWDGVGQMGLDMYAGFRTPNPNVLTGGAAQVPTNPTGLLGQGSNVRAANTIGYKSPSFGGVRIQAATGLGEDIVGRDDSFNVEYGAGPIYAALGYERVRGSAAGSALAAAAQAPNSKDGDSLVNFAFHYDFGMVKPMFYYARAKVAATSTTNKFWSLGALAPIGPGTLKAAYYRLDPAGNNNNRSKFGLGYDYPFSKRTNLYADVGVQRGDGLTSNTTYSFGAKHTF
jgi:predicted porin